MKDVAVWDAYGLTGETWINGEMVHLAKGILPDGFGLQDRIGVTVSPEKMREAVKTAEARRSTAFLVFLPDGIEHSEEEIKGLKDNLGYIHIFFFLLPFFPTFSFFFFSPLSLHFFIFSFFFLLL